MLHPKKFSFYNSYQDLFNGKLNVRDVRPFPFSSILSDLSTRIMDVCPFLDTFRDIEGVQELLFNPKNILLSPGKRSAILHVFVLG